MILKYNQFMESKSNLGEWLLSFDDEYITNIINRFTKNSKLDLDLINVINLLDDSDKKDLEKQVQDYLKYGLNGEKSVNAYVDLNENVSFAGKNTFTSFLKSLTALGYSDNNNELTHKNWLLYYSNKFKIVDIKDIFNRFKSLSNFDNLIPYDSNEAELYFGIKNDLLEYGIKVDKYYKIGGFKLNNSILKWLKNINSKSLFSLKKYLVNLNVNNIILLNNIKNDMINFDLKSEEISHPQITDNIIKFGYKGVGKWDNGLLLDESIIALKKELSNFILGKNWGNKVLISVSYKSYWVYLSIKLK